MPRFFVGLCLGAVLTVCSFRFMGVGHGTYVPMVFTASLIALIPNFGAIPALVLGPFLWALYFLVIPKIRTRRTRVASAVMVLLIHVLSGISLAIEDPAFGRIRGEQLPQLLVFAFLLTLTMALLLCFAVRGSDTVKL